MNVQEGGSKMEYFSVKQIAEKRGVSERAIYKQIKTHEAEIAGHTSKINGKNWYDEVAVKILDEASVQNPVVYLENAEKEEVERLKAENERLKADLDKDRETFRKMYDLIAESQTNAALVAESKLYLEQKEELARKNEVLKEENDQKDVLIEKERKNNEDKDAQIQQLMQRLEEAQKQLDEEKNSYKKTIFGLFKKK